MSMKTDDPRTAGKNDTGQDGEQRRDGSPWPYFSLTLGWSYLFWIPLAISGQKAMAFPWAILLGLGGLGPAVSGVFLTYLTQDARGRKDYWRRVFDFRRISTSWWLIVILAFPALNALGLVTGRLIWGYWPVLESPRALLANPLSLIPFALFTMVFGPFPEELGWSGYALDRLQARRNALTSSLIMGVLWAIWHLPLFFINGAGVDKLWPIGTIPFWVNFAIGVLAMAFLRTWVFNNTNRSTLAVIILHFMANLSGEFLNMPNEFQYFRTVWTVLLALIISIWGGLEKPLGKMRVKRRKVVFSILGVLAVLMMTAGIVVADLAQFPGKIAVTHYGDEVKCEGVKSTFHNGVVYRYPGMVPMLEVFGTHYEMGLQYGVLLRPELITAMDRLGRILRWNAGEMGIPAPILTAVVKYQARQLAARIPERFIQELKGVAEGSGIAYDALLMPALFYDVSQSLGCTGLLMRGPDGTIIHGRNNDTSFFGGEELAKMTVVVRHKALGYNAVTHIDWLGFMGVETGYNDKGLAFSEETLHLKRPNPKGFPLAYLVRMALEESSKLEDLYPFFKRYPTIGAYGTVWSDRDENRGAVIELAPNTWAVSELKGPLMWNFNHFYDSNLKKLQHPQVDLLGFNRDRDALASTFPKKSQYTLDDAVAFLQMQIGPGGVDYSWSGTRTAICNDAGSQMVIFDPRGDGFYLAVGPYYAARQDIWHISDDFARTPELFMKAKPLPSLKEKVAKIRVRLVDRKERLAQFVELAGEYPEEANVNFLVAYYSFPQRRWDLFADHALRAHELEPDVPEYRLYAGMALYQQKQLEKAIEALEGISSDQLYPEEEIYRLKILESVWAERDKARASLYGEQAEAILKQNQAEEYYNKAIAPVIQARRGKK